MINYNQLYYFYVAARCESITEAAKQLHIAQPSLSSQIKVLENSLGKKLFERKGRGLRLTTSGETIFGHCRKIYEQAEILEKEISKGELAHILLHIGVAIDIERPFLIEVVSRLNHLKSEGTRPRIKMSSASHDKLVMQLKSMRVDSIITTEPVFDSELVMLAGAKMPVVLVFNAENKYKKLSGGNLNSVKALAKNFPIYWSLPQKSMRLRRETDVFFEKNKINPEIIFESDVIATVVRAVADNVGVAMLPRPYIRAYSKSQNIRWIGPEEGFWTHNIWLVARRKDQNSERQLLLKEAFKKTMRIDGIR